MLTKDKLGSGVLDVVIDSGGGEIMIQTSKILKHGGKVICYGMYLSYHVNPGNLLTDERLPRTAEPKIMFTMRQVLKNQQLIGTYTVITSFSPAYS